MCGIAGICSRDGGRIDEAGLKRMGAALAHRGPDGEGIHLDRGGAPSVGLVSRRLAVIDVPGGAQPMSTEDDRHTIVYNGELFNADEVRRELETRGHGFETRCDTEVVLRGYAEWGGAVLDRLNGMWAFALWDATERRLFLARDRLGVKPLVYAETPEGFVFGSEIKALTASGLVARDLDLSALPFYLSFFAVSEPHSLVRNVRRLPAGHAMTVDAGGVREWQYWDCAVSEAEDRGREAARRDVLELLDDSVERRLVSDVPLGVLLSGGVDSGIVAALAANHLAAPVRTFTLGFSDADRDERPAAAAAARALGADHTQSEVRAADLAARLPSLLDAYDEPGESLLQTAFVSELAARDVTVALTGLGGDELFGAYPAHVVTNRLARLEKMPDGLRAIASKLGRSLPARSRASRVLALSAMPSDERAARRLMHQVDAPLRRDLLSEELRDELDLDAPARHLEALFERTPAEHPLNRLLYVYLKTYLTDELLRAGDAMSMLHSLELRTPFLDYRLVEQAMAIPARHKMRGRTGKVILREIAGQVLPVEVSRRKQGFAPPIGSWIRDQLEERIRDTLATPTVRRRGVFDPPTVASLVDSCLGGNERAVPAVMMAFSFELWAQRWLDAGGAPEDADSSPAVEIESRVPPDLSVIVVNWNTRERLRECLASIEAHLCGVPHEVLVVDNDSSDGSPEMVEESFPGVRLIRNAENVGFGRANNQAMRVARGRWFMLLNSDAVLVDDSVAALFEQVQEDDGIGVAHCRLEFPDGRLQHSAYPFPTLATAAVENLGFYKLMPEKRAGSMLLSGYWDYAEERDVDWVAGAFMLMPRDVFERTGGFDERLFMYGEDLEWCYRIRDAGWRIRYYPQARVKHYDHASSEIRWGDERVALCLQRQRDIYRERNGRLKTSAFMGIGVLGAALRTAYYSVRALGGKRAEAYGEMRRHTALALRIQLGMLRPRR